MRGEWEIVEMWSSGRGVEVPDHGTGSSRTGEMGTNWGVMWLGRSKFLLQLRTATKADRKAPGMVLIASGRWHGAGGAEKPDPVSSWAKRHVMPGRSLPSWVSYTVFGVECALWLWLLGSGVPPSTRSEEDRWAILDYLFSHAVIGIMISSDAGSQRWVVEVEGLSRVRNDHMPTP